MSTMFIKSGLSIFQTLSENEIKQFDALQKEIFLKIIDAIWDQNYLDEMQVITWLAEPKVSEYVRIKLAMDVKELIEQIAMGRGLLSKAEITQTVLAGIDSQKEHKS